MRRIKVLQRLGMEMIHPVFTQIFLLDALAQFFDFGPNPPSIPKTEPSAAFTGYHRGDRVEIVACHLHSCKKSFQQNRAASHKRIKQPSLFAKMLQQQFCHLQRNPAGVMVKSLCKMRVDGCSLKNLKQKRSLFPSTGFSGNFRIKSRFPGKIPFPRILFFNPFKIRFYYSSAFEGLFFSHFKRKRKQFLFGSPSYVFFDFGKGFLCWC